jgi:hypothetical protein
VPAVAQVRFGERGRGQYHAIQHPAVRRGAIGRVFLQDFGQLERERGGRRPA